MISAILTGDPRAAFTGAVLIVSGLLTIRHLQHKRREDRRRELEQAMRRHPSSQGCRRPLTTAQTIRIPRQRDGHR